MRNCYINNFIIPDSAQAYRMLYPDEAARHLWEQVRMWPAIAYAIKKMVGIGRVMSLRTAVNFDQGNPDETTLQHLDPAPGQTPGGFEVGVQNVVLVGSRMVDHIISSWELWRKGVPPVAQ